MSIHDPLRVEEKTPSLVVDQLVEDTRALLGYGPGRRVIYWLLQQSHIFQTITPDAMAPFHEGERNIGLQLFSFVMMADDAALSKLRDEWRQLMEAAKTGSTERPRE